MSATEKASYQCVACGTRTTFLLVEVSLKASAEEGRGPFPILCPECFSCRIRSDSVFFANALLGVYKQQVETSTVENKIVATKQISQGEAVVLGQNAREVTRIMAVFINYDGKTAKQEMVDDIDGELNINDPHCYRDEFITRTYKRVNVEHGLAIYKEIRCYSFPKLNGIHGVRF